jgi:hypothetical protein
VQDPVRKRPAGNELAAARRVHSARASPCPEPTMRLTRSLAVLLVPLVSLAACDSDIFGPISDPDAPSALSYQLVPSGDPNSPTGVLLTWGIPRSGRAVSFDVFGRSGNGDWLRRATTTSPTFHDAGIPEDRYYVSARDENGAEIGRTNAITIDLSARLQAPLGLTSISLDRAIQLAWGSNAVDNANGTFDFYRVYSTTFDATRGVCTSAWVLEGTTVSDGFLIDHLSNGVTRCFTVSAISRTGQESDWSNARLDTPRLDARGVLVFAGAARPDAGSFLFFDDATHATGVVGASTRSDADFTVDRHSDGTLWLSPGHAGVTVRQFGSGPVPDLTAIDRAPLTGYASTPVQTIPGSAYVFRLTKADGVHFAAVRVAFVGSDYIVFDWSYQSGVGSAELSRIPLR